jgi:hypothetical protein
LSVGLNDCTVLPGWPLLSVARSIDATVMPDLLVLVVELLSILVALTFFVDGADELFDVVGPDAIVFEFFGASETPMTTATMAMITPRTRRPMHPKMATFAPVDMPAFGGGGGGAPNGA